MPVPVLASRLIARPTSGGGLIAPAARQCWPRSVAPRREPVLVSRLPFWGSGFFGYLSLEVWPARQARNAAAACSRSSTLLNLRRGCFGGGTATDVAPLMSSTPRRHIRLRCFIRDQFVRPDITHFLATRATQQSRRSYWRKGPAALP
jgi:hypothetical protein